MRVLVTDELADAGLDRLREAGHEVETAYDITAADLPDAVADANALVVGPDTPVDRAVFEAAPELEIVGRTALDVDNIDVDAATEHGVVVVNTPEGPVRAAAEHTVAMAFAAARDIPVAHALLQDGEWAKSDLLGTELNGKTVGIVGLGRIGREVAKRFRALGMDLVATDPNADPALAERLGAELVEFEECLDRAHFLTLHVPLNDETEQLVGEAELERMADGFVVNCARAGIVDEAALAAAVEDGTLEGAAVDLDAADGVDPDSPLLSVEDVVVNPHPVGDTSETKARVATSLADRILTVFEGEPLASAVNAPSIDESSFPRVRPYVDLAETAGTVAAQLLDGEPTTVEVAYEGDIAGEAVELLTANAVAGVLAADGETVSAVNAGVVADERGVDVRESLSGDAAEFQSLLTVTVESATDAVTVSGTLFEDEEPRIVRIDDYRVDAVPHGCMLVARNEDVPGVIGFIGTVLGDNNVNIAGMFNARESRGGKALTVYNLDDPVPGAVMETIRSDDRVTDVTNIVLNGVE
jgi:D-3-phosphoglycerate dehydrogenase